MGAYLLIEGDALSATGAGEKTIGVTLTLRGAETWVKQNDDPWKYRIHRYVPLMSIEDL